MYVTLRCAKCDNTDCPLARRYVPEDSQEGCTRQVTDEQGEKFHHYLQETMPFVQLYKDHQAAIDQLELIYQFLTSIYSAPLGRRLDSKGKAVSSR